MLEKAFFLFLQILERLQEIQQKRIESNKKKTID